MCDKITQSSGGKKRGYTAEILHYMHNDVIFLERCNKNVCYKSLSHH